MTHNNAKEMALFEHRFWLQIFGDHSRFILNALSPMETCYVQRANGFIKLFDNLLEKARKSISSEKLHELNYEAYSAAMKIRELKLDILSKQIAKQIRIGISPSFINLMLNEVEQYICILNDLIKGDMLSTKDIQLHLFWLEDGMGHADAIANALDSTQKEVIEKSREYTSIFTDLYIKTVKYNGYSRTGICDFAALKKLNIDVDYIMSGFKEFLKDLECDILEKEVLGTIFPLMVEHMYREECYYLTKLSMVSETEAPKCDPTKPRIEE